MLNLLYLFKWVLFLCAIFSTHTLGGRPAAIAANIYGGADNES